MRCGRPLFDDYVMVDWSAANAPRRGRDSIWLCHLERSGGGHAALTALENPPTRRLAEARLRALLVDARERRRSLLLGCDFAFGYASGFAARLGLAGPPWRGVWDTIAGGLTDGRDNRSNRFDLAASLNRRVSGGAFPFWGCPAGRAGPHLAMTHHRRHIAEGLAEARLVDRLVPGIQPGWKLAGAGSVGSQTLTGIPVLRRLREDPDLAPAARLWPFEIGLRKLGRDDVAAMLVIAEIYPSLVALAPGPQEVKDAAQVRATARHFAELDEGGALGRLFAGDPALSEAERRRVEREEGWVLGVTGPARRCAEAPRPRRSPPPATLSA